MMQNSAAVFSCTQTYPLASSSIGCPALPVRQFPRSVSGDAVQDSLSCLYSGCRETNALKAAVEQSKNEVLRYSLSLILALVAAGLTAARVLPDFSKK